MNVRWTSITWLHSIRDRSCPLSLRRGKSLSRTHLEVEWNSQFARIGGQWGQGARREDQTRKGSLSSIREGEERTIELV